MGTDCLRFLFLSTLLSSLQLGCGSEGDRCAKCGMMVEDAPRWIAGLVNKAGAPQRFCCPRCMFAWCKSPRGEGSRDPWVTEYYTQKKMPADEVLFVVGSDVVGSMGKSLVPVAGREAAVRFQRDHGGARIVSPSEITVELLKEIAGK